MNKFSCEFHVVAVLVWKKLVDTKIFEHKIGILYT